MALCEHFRWVHPQPHPGDDGEGMVYPEPHKESTFEDIVPGQGRFRCTQCGHIGYYTGLWRDFWERGIPCSGSEGIRREDTANPQELAELLEYAKRAPRVSEQDVQELCLMSPHELRRRCIVHRDWHRLFAQCLDGLPLRHLAGAAPDGCWEPDTIRRVVEKLLASADADRR